MFAFLCDVIGKKGIFLPIVVASVFVVPVTRVKLGAFCGARDDVTTGSVRSIILGAREKC